ncbi:MAG: ABC transporter ATP-binding protein [Devosia sp.]
MAGVTLDGLGKTYGHQTVLEDLSLEIEDGEFVVFVGPSGCGKSTALKIIAGLEMASAGRVFIGGRDVTDLSPGKRDVAMVFQNYALYPHLSVRMNMGFGLKVRGISRKDIAERVEWAAQILGLGELLDRRPRALSGGQRQRVALGRAIVREPDAFLMDEPLSNLDAKLRTQMRSEITTLHRRLGVTTIYVTHDQTEAMTMADRIVLMRNGKVQQIAGPDTMYERPENLFVAAFIGSPGMNLLRGRLSGGSLQVAGAQIPTSVTGSGDVIVGYRPEHVLPQGAHEIALPIRGIEKLGAERHFFLEMPASAALSEGDSQLAGEGGSQFVARLDSTVPGDIGGSLVVGLDPQRVHIFHRETGAAMT